MDIVADFLMKPMVLDKFIVASITEERIQQINSESHIVNYQMLVYTANYKSGRNLDEWSRIS